MPTSIFKKNFPGVEALQEAVDAADYIIGLDLHKKTTAICVVDPNNPKEPLFQRKRLKNVDLITRIQSFPGKKVVTCEAAYGWFPLRDALTDIPDTTFVALDSRKTSSWVATSGIKSDKVDAQILCHVCLHGGVASLAVHQPSRQARDCCKLVRYRDQLVRQRTRIKNQLKAIDRDYGANLFTGEIPEQSPLAIFMESALREHLQFIEKHVRNAEEQMASLGKDDEIVALIRSIPGIGPITSFMLRHKIETLDRFAAPAHLASYFGFGVRERQSGNRLIKGQITKTGNVLIRKLLIQGAQAVRSAHPEYLPLYFPTMGQEKLMQDYRHANKLVTALARKNLTFVYHIWKDRIPFDIEGYRQRRELHAQPTASSSEKAAELDCEFVREGRE